MRGKYMRVGHDLFLQDIPEFSSTTHSIISCIFVKTILSSVLPVFSVLFSFSIFFSSTIMLPLFFAALLKLVIVLLRALGGGLSVSDVLLRVLLLLVVVVLVSLLSVPLFMLVLSLFVKPANG